MKNLPLEVQLFSDSHHVVPDFHLAPQLPTGCTDHKVLRGQPLLGSDVGVASCVSIGILKPDNFIQR